MLKRADRQRYFNMVMRTARLAAHTIPGYLPTRQVETVDPNTPNYLYDLEEEMIRRVKNEENFSDLLRLPLEQDHRQRRSASVLGDSPHLHPPHLPWHHHHQAERAAGPPPMIEYYAEDGKPLGEPYRSLYSHEQIIRYCMRALISQRQGKGGIKFLFLGTHRDLEGDSVGESLKDKNRKLQYMVNSLKIDDHVVYFRGFDLIFAINAKSPADRDWEVMAQVREVIAESSNVPPIRIPIKWYAMELALLRHVQETKRSVLLESECFRMAKSFHFD